MVFDSVYEMTNYLKSPIITPTVTVSDDYTSNKGYVDNTSDWAIPASGKIDFQTIRRSTTSQEMYIDLQDSDYLGSGNNLSDSKWVVRFGKFKVVNEATGSGNILLHLCLSNTNGSSGGTQQTHSCQVNFSQSEGGYTNYCTTGNLHGSGASQQNVTGTAGMADGDERYIEMSRSGNDFTVKICSDANYSTVLGSGTQTKTGISGLRYLKFVNDSEQNGSSTASAELSGSIKIYNGESTTSSYPKPRGQHFWEYFSGGSLNSRWSSHGSGSASITGDGMLLTSPTNGAQSIDLSPSDAGKIRPFSPTGAVMIVTSKLIQAQYSNQSNGFRTNYYTEAGKYVVMAIQGQTNGNSSDNKIQLKSNNPSTAVDTTLASSAIHDWHTYKLELLTASSTLNVDGLLQVTGSCNPDIKCQPYLNTATAEGTISGGAKANYRYCEVYNT